MYQLTDEQRNGLRIVELKDAKAGSWLRVAPERGGILIGLGIDGAELFYLNEETLFDKNANIRGGNPILFPVCGGLAEGQYTWGERSYKMKSHGLARNMRWEIEQAQEIDGAAVITVRTESNEETLADYPFAFQLRFRYILKDKVLTIAQEYTNRSAEPMPMYAGLHPYFNCRSKAIDYEADALRQMSYVERRPVPFTGKVDVTATEDSVVLLDFTSPKIAFALPEFGRRIELGFDERFKYVVIWSQIGKDFICVEPWMALPDELNRKQELVMVPPGENFISTVTITSARCG